MFGFSSGGSILSHYIGEQGHQSDRLHCLNEYTPPSVSFLELEAQGRALIFIGMRWPKFDQFTTKSIHFLRECMGMNLSFIGDKKEAIG